MSTTGYKQLEEVPNALNGCEQSRKSHSALCSLLFCVGLVSAAFWAYNGSHFHSRSSSPILIEEEVIVRLPRGYVRGVATDGNGNRFGGIRYGNAGRFQNPELAEEIVGEYDARFLALPCMHQFVRRSDGFSEDCLHLDIYQPSPLEQDTHVKVPVLFWLHGLDGLSRWGYFVKCDYALDRPEELVEHLQLVVVKVKYRIDVFGFLGSRRLQSNPNQSVGNYGNLDQQVALRWVNKNIQYFRGNRDSICLMGWSVGAAHISLHVTGMPGSKGLFHKAIMLSGGFTDWAAGNMEWAESQYDEILKATGCDRSQPCNEPGPPCDCLLSKTAEEIAAASKHIRTWWCPKTDGIALLKTPLDALNAGEALKNIPILLGTTLDDSDQDLGPDATESELSQVFMAPANKAGLGVAPSMLNEAKNLYLENITFPADIQHGLQRRSDSYWATRRAFADQSKTCYSRRAAVKYKAKTGANAYFYYWQGQAYHNPQCPHHTMTNRSHDDLIIGMGHCSPCPGSAHGGDLHFLFNRTLQPLDDKMVMMNKVMQSFWSNFIYNGDPNKGEGVLQEVWSPMPEGGMDFRFGMSAFVPDLKAEECSFWDRVGYGTR